MKTYTPQHRDLGLSPLERIREARKAGRIGEAQSLITDEAKRQGVFGNLGRMPADLLYEWALLQSAPEHYAVAVDALTLVAGMVPNEPKVWRSLGLAQEIVGDYRGAFIAYKTGVDLCREVRYDDESRLWIGYGAQLFRVGRASEGEEIWRKALRKPASSPEAIYQRAQIKFALGKWTLDAWEDYEARKQMSGYDDGIKARGGMPKLPEWDGKSEGRVCCTMSQGAGDVIQFARYLTAVAQQSGTAPDLAGGEPLEAFLKSFDRGIVFSWDGPEFVAHLDSMPLLLRRPEPIPPHCTNPWRRPQNPKPRIGVCWKGSSKHLNDKDRSSPLDPRPMLQDERWELVNLQTGEGFNPKDYLETAEFMRTLDAVVTVDTSVVHVAGTLGVPTVLIPPSCPEWRWGLRSGATPWYPSVQQLRRTDVWAWDDAWRRAEQKLVEVT